jgi:RHS repeat-associated protein
MTHIVASLREATYERKQLLDYTLGDPAIDLYSGFSVLDDKLSLSEWPIYGSARLGVLDLNGKGELYNNGTAMWTKPLSHTKAGYRQYEITNHLGNVLATISDVKHGIDDPVDGTIDYYNPVPLSQQDYYPFGMLMPGRNDVKYEYRFGFNGKENDNEVKGKGNSLDYGARIHDPRLGRFLSVDPITESYPMLTPYQFASNTPISAIDLDGFEAKIAIFGGSTADPKSVPVFKLAAERDVSLGASISSPHSIERASNFMKLLEQKTSDEGSIARVVIFSHANQYATFFNDNGGQNTGSSLMRRGTSYGHKDQAGFKDIVAGMKNGTISFEVNALVIFAGCNSGSPFGINKTDKTKKGDPIVPYAEDFTMATGVSSIGASGKVKFIDRDGQSILSSDYGFYRFDYDSENKNVIKTFLGKEINASDYQVETPQQNTVPDNNTED